MDIVKLDNLSNKFFVDNVKRVRLSKAPTKMDRGMYMIYKFHGGYSGMGKFYIISLTEYEAGYDKPDHPNKFVKAISLLSNDNSDANPIYDLYYNPTTNEVRLDDSGSIEELTYIAIKLVDY